LRNLKPAVRLTAGDGYRRPETDSTGDRGDDSFKILFLHRPEQIHTRRAT
jgi:hypothetical protein